MVRKGNYYLEGRLGIIKFGELLLWISLRVNNAFRSYIKQSKECSIRYIQTLRSSLKELGCASFSQPTSQCLDIWWNILPCVWYITSFSATYEKLSVRHFEILLSNPYNTFKTSNVACESGKMTPMLGNQHRIIRPKDVACVSKITPLYKHLKRNNERNTIAIGFFC